jgi:hypothetical protein
MPEGAAKCTYCISDKMHKEDRKLEGKLRIDGAMSVYVNKDA